MGQSWQRYLSIALDRARCVVVVWTEASVQSEWVYEEAARGKDRGVLVPVMLDDVAPPLGFGIQQAARLVNWPKSQEGRDFTQMLAAIERLAPRLKDSRSDPSQTRDRPVAAKFVEMQRKPLLALASMMLVGLAVTLWYVKFNPQGGGREVIASAEQSPKELDLRDSRTAIDASSETDSESSGAKVQSSEPAVVESDKERPQSQVPVSGGANRIGDPEDFPEGARLVSVTYVEPDPSTIRTFIRDPAWIGPPIDPAVTKIIRAATAVTSCDEVELLARAATNGFSDLSRLDSREVGQQDVRATIWSTNAMGKARACWIQERWKAEQDPTDLMLVCEFTHREKFEAWSSHFKTAEMLRGCFRPVGESPSGMVPKNFYRSKVRWLDSRESPPSASGDDIADHWEQFGVAESGLSSREVLTEVLMWNASSRGAVTQIRIAAPK